RETIEVSNASCEENANAPAILRGVTDVTLACGDAACTVPLPGILAMTSCTDWAPGVCGCALEPSDITDNTVRITMCADGISLPPGAAMDLVTINALAVAPITTAGATFFTGAATGLSDLEACSSTTPGLCSTDAARGGLSLSFPASTSSPASLHS